jgi:PAS domain S-box-containing protein
MLVKSLLPTRMVRSLWWAALALLVLAIDVVISLHVERGASVVIYGSAIHFLPLLLATGVATLNAVQNGQSIRLFWAFLAASFGLWALNPLAWIYYEMVFGKDRPDFLFGSTPLFLHTVLMIAAVAARPHLRLSRNRPYRTTLSFLTVLFFWVFLYAFTFFPYKYGTLASPTILRFQAFYLSENLLLLAALGVLIFRAKPPWKPVYWHLLGASSLYMFASLGANLKLALNETNPGLYEIPYSAAVLWFVWVALVGRKLAPQLAQTVQLDDSNVSHASILAMVSVAAIPALGVWELFRADELYQTRVIRLLIVLISAFVLAVVVFLKEYLANRELSSDVILANKQYRRIVETTAEGIWLLDSKFHTSFVNRQMAGMLGYKPGEMRGRSVFDFYFPEDVERKQQILARRRDGLSEHFDDRLRRRDGSGLWVRMAAIPIYKDNGDFEGAMAIVSDVSSERLAQEALRESEERFRLVADTAPALIWMSGTDKLCTFFNKGWLDFTGRCIDFELGNGWAEGVHHEDLEWCLDSYVRAFDAREEFRIEFRLRRYDGEYRWIMDIGVPRFNQDGSFAGFIGSGVDVTDRKLAEKALAGVSRRLIEAQETERTRIARELHDDIGQRLALLNIELEQLRHSPPDLAAVLGRLTELKNQTSEIATDVQSMSHELHSSKLEYLGIATAMKGFCKEFSEQQKVEVVFIHDEIPPEVPQDISLCLFRILQEALRNAMKHSGVRHFEAELRYALGEIHLAVRDCGSGFDNDAAKESRGLGLVSMAERVKLVDGQLSIDSQPKRGTTVHARVPLTSGSNSMRAAG